MKKLVLVILLVSSPAWAQTKLTPKNTTARVDNCAPIGRTADGKLVYSMKCDNLPAPPAPPPQAEVREVPAPRSGAGSSRSGISAGPMNESGRTSKQFQRQLECSLLPTGYNPSPFSISITGSSMSQLIVHVGEFTFNARFEEQLAPKTSPHSARRCRS